MSAYRELRLRLNLGNQRDRSLVHAIDKAVENTGAPVASILRRALERYLREGWRDSESTPNVAGRDAQVAHDRHPTQNDVAVARTATHDGPADIEGSTPELMATLASIGTPPAERYHSS